MSSKEKASKSLQGIAELFDDPCLLVNKELEILHKNETAIDFLESRKLGHINKLVDIPWIKNAVEAGKFELSKSNLKIGLDAEMNLSIKPVRRGNFYLVAIKQKNQKEKMDFSTIDWNPMAKIVHDMKTPLTAMIGFTRLLATTNLEDKEKNLFLERAEDNLTYLEGIIAELLQFSKQKSDKIRVEKKIVNSRAFLEGLCRNIEVIAQNRSLKCFWDICKNIPQKISIDTNGVRHVVDNLAGNAVKYTPTGKISIRFDYDADKSHLKFIVKDSGIGIAAENQDSIFDPFFQEAQFDRGGVGLGLSIIKVYSQAMGGDAYLIESHKDQGSTFGAHFDCSIQGEISEQSIPDLSQSANNPEKISLLGVKILVVDDSPDIQLLVKKVFTSIGAEVTALGSSKTALEYLNENPIDLLVSDMQMPEYSGGELLDLAREQGYQGPAIALTGLEESKVIENGSKNQFSCYLTKPFRFDVLRSLAFELVKNDERN